MTEEEEKAKAKEEEEKAKAKAKEEEEKANALKEKVNDIELANLEKKKTELSEIEERVDKKTKQLKAIVTEVETHGKGLMTKPLSNEDKKVQQSKEYFKGTALGDAIKEANE